MTIVFAATVTPSPATAPTDMSIPPTAMVSVTPRPRIAATDTYRRVSRRVAESRKDGSLSAKYVKSVTVTKMKPYLMTAFWMRGPAAATGVDGVAVFAGSALWVVVMGCFLGWRGVGPA